MSEKVFIGIDTSNYTTSFAICNLDGKILENHKILLPVKEGERGLRQSDAVFAHIKNFFNISERIKNAQNQYKILAIGCSAFPRDCEGSYMPCFLVGESFCELITSIYNLECYKFSHQAGHIMAALYSSNASIQDDFVAFHVSGGTTEILHVKPKSNGLEIKQIGGTNDLNAGQAIDRIGVKLGLKFPCGPAMEALAKNNKQDIPRHKISVQRFECNLSGLENLAENLYSKSQSKELTAAFVLDYISRVLEKITQNIREQYKCENIIYAGGVMSNLIIQSNLGKKFDNVFFSTYEFSSDNASGIALLTRNKFLNKEV